MNSEVAVLLSSYNGAKYISEQLQSLIGQSYSDLAIHVRDDGSSDGTRRILKSYATKHPQIHLLFGERLGIAGSFFWLLGYCGQSSRYFAFCDQDDVWYPDKIERAVASLCQIEPDMPALYCSRLEYVNADGAHLKYSTIPARGLSFQAALAENSATGATVVLNRAARDLILRSLPDKCIMHDWWCYLVVTAFGVVVYDQSPGLRYRLHGANDTGAAVSVSEDFARRVRRFWREPRGAFKIHAQATEFAERYSGLLADDKRRLLERFLHSKHSLVTRLHYAVTADVHRQSRLDDWLLRVLLVLGWY